MPYEVTRYAFSAFVLALSRSDYKHELKHARLVTADLCCTCSCAVDEIASSNASGIENPTAHQTVHPTLIQFDRLIDHARRTRTHIAAYASVIISAILHSFDKLSQ